jgi:hypothetical protein
VRSDHAIIRSTDLIRFILDIRMARLWLDLFNIASLQISSVHCLDFSPAAVHRIDGPFESCQPRPPA